MGKSLQRTVFKWLRVAALVGPGVETAVRLHREHNPTDVIVSEVLGVYTGFDFRNRKWDLGKMAYGWGPFLGAVLATYGIPKIAGIIRKL